jgi:hypothetical protein
MESGFTPCGDRIDSSPPVIVVPIGTRLVATLDENLSTKTTRDRDAFR